MTKRKDTTHYADLYYPLLADYKSGIGIRALARMYDISVATVHNWVHKKSKPKNLDKPIMRYDNGKLVTHHDEKEKNKDDMTVKEPDTKTIQIPVSVSQVETQTSGFFGANLWLTIFILLLFFVIPILAILFFSKLPKLL